MRVPLWDNQTFPDTGENNRDCPRLDLYLLEGDQPHPIVVVCPGGGYGVRADHEAEPIARWLNQNGVSAVVLHYRVAPNRHPIPLEDARRAVRLVRHHATTWRIDPARIGILGFSAGGHLAATLGTHYDSGNPTSSDPVERESCRPDFMILCYAVISLDGNRGSKFNLLGDTPDEDLLAWLANDKHVTRDTPRAFIWHTADDAAVPVDNALRMSLAMAQHGVPCELHVFREGVHGLGLAEHHREVGAWTSLCEAWMRAERITS